MWGYRTGSTARSSLTTSGGEGAEHLRFRVLGLLGHHLHDAYRWSLGGGSRDPAVGGGRGTVRAAGDEHSRWWAEPKAAWWGDEGTAGHRRSWRVWEVVAGGRGEYIRWGEIAGTMGCMAVPGSPLFKLASIIQIRLQPAGQEGANQQELGFHFLKSICTRTNHSWLIWIEGFS
jgi:hypothetical protein